MPPPDPKLRGSRGARAHRPATSTNGTKRVTTLAASTLGWLGGGAVKCERGLVVEH